MITISSCHLMKSRSLFFFRFIDRFLRISNTMLAISNGFWSKLFFFFSFSFLFVLLLLQNNQYTSEFWLLYKLVRKKQEKVTVACYASKKKPQKRQARWRVFHQQELSLTFLLSFAYLLLLPLLSFLSHHHHLLLLLLRLIHLRLIRLIRLRLIRLLLLLLLLVTSLFHVIDRVRFLSTLFINDTAAASRFSASFSRQFNPIQLNDHFGTDLYSHVPANLLDKVHRRNQVPNHLQLIRPIPVFFHRYPAKRKNLKRKFIQRQIQMKPDICCENQNWGVQLLMIRHIRSNFWPIECVIARKNDGEHVFRNSEINGRREDVKENEEKYERDGKVDAGAGGGGERRRGRRRKDGKKKKMMMMMMMKKKKKKKEEELLFFTSLCPASQNELCYTLQYFDLCCQSLFISTRKAKSKKTHPDSNVQP